MAKEHTEEELTKLNAALYDAVKDQLDTPELRAWCTERTRNRYIRARKYKLDDAIKMLKASIDWRRERQPERITWASIESEASSGKMYVRFDTKDLEGRPVLVMRPRNQNTANHDDQIRYFIYVMERASLLTDRAGHDKMCWVLDFPGYSMRTAPPMKTSMETLRILQDHYPERLGMAVCYKPPYIFQAFYKVIKPFVDPVTAKKVCFVPEKEVAQLMPGVFNMEQLEEPLGGRNPCSYDTAVWSVEMQKLEAECWAEAIAEGRKMGVDVSPPESVARLAAEVAAAAAAATPAAAPEKQSPSSVEVSVVASGLADVRISGAEQGKAQAEAGPVAAAPRPAAAEVAAPAPAPAAAHRASEDLDDSRYHSADEGYGPSDAEEEGRLVPVAAS